MSEMKPNTQCKDCRYWPKGLWDFPCRACTNEGRKIHPMQNDKISNHFKRRKDKPAYSNARVGEKKREMGL